MCAIASALDSSIRQPYARRAPPNMGIFVSARRFASDMNVLNLKGGGLRWTPQPKRTTSRKKRYDPRYGAAAHQRR